MTSAMEHHPAGQGTAADRPSWVIGPLGQRLTMALLPSPRLRHWLPMRKAEVVAAVKGGLLTIDEALARYRMTIEEFANWERAVERFGLNGLRTTRTAHYRALQERQQKF